MFALPGFDQAKTLLAAAAVAALTVALLWGYHTWAGRLVARGDAQGAARVQAAWDKVTAAAAQQRARDEETARRDEATRTRNAERIAHEQARREGALQARAARADARLGRLLDTLARLDADDAADLSGAGAHPGLAAIAGKAAAARQLLGQCAGRYRSLAGEADALAGQVSGLQQFVAQACQPQGQEQGKSHDH